MLFTTRQCQDSTPTMTPLLWAPACGVDDGSGQQQNGVTSDDRGNRAGTRNSKAKMPMATSTPSLWAAVCRVETTGTVKTGRMQQRKRRGATTTKITGQDDTDTDNKGTDDNNNNNDEGDQGTSVWRSSSLNWKKTKTELDWTMVQFFCSCGCLIFYMAAVAVS